eukprot:jgi/Mesen1/9171/ME000591S08498
MAKGARLSTMPALGIWLLLLAFLRLSSVYFAFFNSWALKTAVFSKAEVTSLHARTFGTWTALTCMLTAICAFNLDCKPLYLATVLSFIVAFAHFFLELVLYGTMSISNFATVGTFAGVSVMWMLLEWGKHFPSDSDGKKKTL